MEFAAPPICPKCDQEMDDCTMEAVLAPPAPTMYLSKWSCSRHKNNKTDKK